MIVLVALAGGVGAALRFLVDSAVSRRTRLLFGTVLVNVSGSFLLGLLVALTAGQTTPERVLAVAGTGLLGGYTTFSAASIEAAQLARVQGGRPLVSAVAHATAMLSLSLAAAALGLWLG